VAEALNLLGVKRAMVVHSDGLDEISTTGPTKVIELKTGDLAEWTLNPGDYNISKADLDSLGGGNAKNNAEIVRNILGSKDTGPRRDIVVLNAAAAIFVSGLADDFAPAVKMAADAVQNGASMQALKKFIEISNS